MNTNRMPYTRPFRKDILKRLLSENTKETELIRAGLVPEYLEFMKPDDRVRILHEAGLNPEEYDF